jgi:hypothetical protein
VKSFNGSAAGRLLRAAGRATLVILASSLAVSVARADVLQVESSLRLEQAQIVNCLGGFGIDEPSCWAAGLQSDGVLVDLPLPTTLLAPGDTLRLVVSFAEGYRLRWQDDGVVIPDYGDEFVQVTFFSASGAPVVAAGTFAGALEFVNATGGLLSDRFDWAGSALTGGLIVGTFIGGSGDILAGYAEFSGFAVEYRLLEGTGLPATIDAFTASFGSGEFSIVAPVPVPPGGLLLGTGLAGFIGRWLGRRHRQLSD